MLFAHICRFDRAMNTLPPASKLPARLPFSRNALIAASVVVLHVGFIWGLQSGLLMRAAELVVPVELLSQIIEPPAPKPDTPRPPPPPPPPPTPAKISKAVTQTPAAVAPQPLAIQDAAPSPNAPVGTLAPPVALAPIAAPVAAAPVAPPAPPAVQLPVSDADYLQNPRPPYPPMSKRLGEQGKTLLRVTIGTDGVPQRAEIAKSSGFDRLDQAALSTVMRWRYVPGKRGGVPEVMSFNVPIDWVLE